MVYQSIHAIPAGKVAAYGQIAELAGLKGKARWIGRVLSELPSDSKLPWHRVLRASGELAFPVDSARFARQRERLLAEGIAVNNGRVARVYFWEP